MWYRHNFIFFTIIILLVFYNLTGKELPELVTKQTTYNLLFISQDGKITYYQKNSGELLLSKNYQIIPVLEAPPGSRFSLLGSNNRQKLIVTMDPFYFNSQRQNHETLLYQLNWGESNPTPIGKGRSPTLHLQDSWVTYYKNDEKKIIFQSLQKPIQFSISIRAAYHPYFTPQVVMVRESDILYTDINQKGETAVILLDRNTKKLTSLLVNTTVGVKVELCLSQNQFFIGEFGYPGSSFGSRISYLNLNRSRNFNKMEVIYLSAKQDPGNIVCDGKSGVIYFAQNQDSEKQSALFYSDIVQLDVQTKQVTTLSQLKYATQLFNMDGRVLIPFNGKFYVLEGSAQVANDALPKSATSSTITPPQESEEQ